jgi:hypothetical protein
MYTSRKAELLAAALKLVAFTKYNCEYNKELDKAAKLADELHKELSSVLQDTPYKTGMCTARPDNTTPCGCA